LSFSLKTKQKMVQKIFSREIGVKKNQFPFVSIIYVIFQTIWSKAKI
jgi:hypothetical protein